MGSLGAPSWHGGLAKFGLVPLAMSAAGLSTGTRVTLCGLQARPELNGKSCRVLVKRNATSGRCGATLCGVTPLPLLAAVPVLTLLAAT